MTDVPFGIADRERERAGIEPLNVSLYIYLHNMYVTVNICGAYTIHIPMYCINTIYYIACLLLILLSTIIMKYIAVDVYQCYKIHLCMEGEPYICHWTIITNNPDIDEGKTEAINKNPFSSTKKK